MGDGPTTFTLTTDVTNGTLVFSPDGTYTYTPDPDYNGTDVFTYTVCDANNECATATVTITVNPVNDTPVVANDNPTINEDIPLVGTVAGNDTGLGDGPITFTLTTDVTDGILIFNPDGTYTYTPDPDFNGTDSFTYTVCDYNGECATATVTITINPVNDVPVAVDDIQSIDMNGTLINSVGGNDTGLGDGSLTFALNTDVTNGTLTFNPDGIYTYTPDPDFSGTDSFTYTVCDLNGECSPATVTITVLVPDHIPIAVNDEISIDEDNVLNSNVFENDLGLEDAPVSFAILQNVLQGTLILNSDGTYNYTPAENFNGEDTFTYTVCDADGDCATATVTITVNVVNDAPVAEPDFYQVKMNAGTTLLNVSDNDTDVDNDLVPGSVVIIKSPNSGSEVSVDNLGNINYTPALNFFGIDSIPYQIFDATGLSDVDTFFVTIETEITVTNTFSPNGDGINDVLIIPNIEDYDNEIFIYNRWGNEVFHIVNYRNDINAWDGRAQSKTNFGGNQILPVGTYFYILKLNGNNKPLKGYIYLQY